MKYITTLIFLSLFLLFSVTASAQKKKKSKEETIEVLTEQQRSAQADMFTNAVLEREKGNFTKSLELFNRAIEMNPNDAASYYEYARMLQALGRNDEALASAKKAIELEEDNKWYLVLYGNISKSTGNYNEYARAYALLAESYPADLNFLNELAYAYIYLGEYNKAIVVYKQIEEMIGINEPLTTQIVQLYDNLGEKEKALAEYERLIEIYPDESRYYALLAEYCAKNKMNDKVIWAYEKIVEINPDDPYVHISLADYYKKSGDEQRAFEELKIGLANPALDLKTKINLLFAYYPGDLNETQLKQALELSEILRQTHSDDVLSETFYASMLYENKQYEASREILKKILVEDQGNYALWEQLLFCNLYLEDYQTLAETSENVIDLFPSYPLPYFLAGIANFQVKDFVKAEAYLVSGKNFIINNNALLEQFWSSLGDTYNELGNYDASYNAYDNALSLNPSNAVVLNNYAYYLSLRGAKLDKAEKMAKKSVEMDPYNSNNLDTYAWVLYKQGKYEMALEWIKKAYGNGGENSGVVLEHYGDILFKLGKPDEALEYWKKAKMQKDYSDLLDSKITDKTLYE